MQLTHAAAQLQWLLVWSQSCATCHCRLNLEHFHLPKSNPVPLSSHPHLPPASSCLSIRLLWTVHINGITVMRCLMSGPH